MIGRGVKPLRGQGVAADKHTHQQIETGFYTLHTNQKQMSTFPILPVLFQITSSSKVKISHEMMQRHVKMFTAYSVIN